MGLFKKTEGIDPQQPQTDTIHEKDVEKNYEDVRLEARQASVDNGGSAPYIDPVIEKRVVRKIDWHLVPLLMALYLLAFLDRSNIGNAKTAGMAKALDLTADRYSWLLTIFYISYILFQFQVMGWKRFKPHIWASWAIFGWYVCDYLSGSKIANMSKGCYFELSSRSHLLGRRDGTSVS